jgi:signal transduction histidine kinase
MNLENSWKQLGQQKDEDLSSLLQAGSFRKLHSSNPLHKIKNSLVFSMVWAVVIASGYVYVMILFPQWQVLLCIGIVLLFTLWAGYTAYLQYRNIRLFVMEDSLLAEMKKHYAGINSWMKMQMKAAIFVYPMAAAGGFMIGGMLGSGKSIESFLGKPVIIIALIITICILVPLSMQLAKWLFKKSFGKHLAQLKKNLDELENG